MGQAYTQRAARCVVPECAGTRGGYLAASRRRPHGPCAPPPKPEDPPLKSASATTFDEAYYQRFYFDKKTSVVDPQHMERLGTFVCSYLKYLRVPVHRVLDVGCGIGLWKGIVAQHFPQASYQGVEISSYLCERYGWQQGSVVDYVADKPFDLVICQGVLPYLSPVDLKTALLNLGRLSQGALYVEAVSREDYEQDIIDEDLTDNRVFRHRADLYRRGLREGAVELGGGVWLSRKAGLPLFALEQAGGQ
jgi:predicted TPR repeat methyltransferase